MTHHRSLGLFRWVFMPFHNCFRSQPPRHQRRSPQMRTVQQQHVTAPPQYKRSDTLVQTPPLYVPKQQTVSPYPQSSPVYDMASRQPSRSSKRSGASHDVPVRHGASPVGGLRREVAPSETVRRRTPVGYNSAVDDERFSSSSSSTRNASPSPSTATTSLRSSPHLTTKGPVRRPDVVRLDGHTRPHGPSKPLPLKPKAATPTKPLFTDVLSSSPSEMGSSEYPTYSTEDDDSLDARRRRLGSRKASFNHRRGGIIDIVYPYSESESEEEQAPEKAPSDASTRVATPPIRYFSILTAAGLMPYSEVPSMSINPKD